MCGFVYVCGPSGAGKDSLIGYARERLAGATGIAFATRVMTRPAGPRSAHRTLALEEFAAREAAGAFCLVWGAHGHRYAVEVEALARVREGIWVVVSGSREHAPQARALAPATRVVLVTAPELLIRRRLLERGRDSPEAIAEREARNQLWAGIRGDLEILNGDDLCRSGERFVAALRAWVGGSR